MLARRHNASGEAFVIDDGLAFVHAVVLARIDQDGADKGPARIRNNARRNKAGFRVWYHTKHAPKFFVFMRELLGNGLPFQQGGILVFQNRIFLVHFQQGIDFLHKGSGGCGRV